MKSNIDPLVRYKNFEVQSKEEGSTKSSKMSPSTKLST
jgi:hypothetical protein